MGQKGFSGIYQITCLVNGQRYVGSAVDVHRRRLDHHSYLRRGKHVNVRLQRCYDKHGAANLAFEVVELVEPSKLHEAEAAWLATTKPELNINPRPDAPMRGRKHTPEARAKISAANRARVVSAETRALRSRLFTGVKLAPRSEEFKRKVGEGLRRAYAEGRRGRQ